MLTSLRFTAAPFVVLLALMSGCSTKQTQATYPSPPLPTEPAPSPVTSLASSSLQTDPFQDASDKAIGATTISQSALSKDDWNLVAGMWQEAINLMKAVPPSSPNYALAQKKVAEYQRSLANVDQQSQSNLVEKYADKLMQIENSTNFWVKDVVIYRVQIDDNPNHRVNKNNNLTFILDSKNNQIKAVLVNCKTQSTQEIVYYPVNEVTERVLAGFLPPEHPKAEPVKHPTPISVNLPSEYYPLICK